MSLVDRKQFVDDRRYRKYTLGPASCVLPTCESLARAVQLLRAAVCMSARRLSAVLLWIVCVQLLSAELLGIMCAALSCC